MVSAPDGRAHAVALAQQLRHQVRRHEPGASGNDGDVPHLARHGGERATEGPVRGVAWPCAERGRRLQLCKYEFWVITAGTA